MITVRPNDKVKFNTSHGIYKVGHAPNGGRVVDGGVVYPTPFAYIFPCAHVIDNYGGSGKEFADAPRLTLGEPFEIEGYGIHVAEPYSAYDNTNLRITRLSDGFKA